MTTKEIRELLVLKEWTRGQLASMLGLAHNTVARWFVAPEDQQRHPSPEHVLKMRAWLTEARQSAYSESEMPKSSQKRQLTHAK